jgi:hypothetical protein
MLRRLAASKSLRRIGANATELLGLGSVGGIESPIRQIVCNLESGACNPDPIRQLSQLGWNIRTNPRLHAKVYLFPSAAVVGSANPSTNGLSFDFYAGKGWDDDWYGCASAYAPSVG